MFTELSQAFGVVSGSFQVLKAAVKTFSKADVDRAVADLHQHILDLQDRVAVAQTKYDEIAEVKRKLQNELIERDNWDKTAAKYEMSKLATGAVMYALKPDHQVAEPFHWICPRCYNHRKHSILQPTHGARAHYECECGFKAVVEDAPPGSGVSRMASR